MGTTIDNTIVAVYKLRMLAPPLGMRCGNLLRARNNGISAFSIVQVNRYYFTYFDYIFLTLFPLTVIWAIKK